MGTIEEEIEKELEQQSLRGEKWTPEPGPPSHRLHLFLSLLGSTP